MDFIYFISKSYFQILYNSNNFLFFFWDLITSSKIFLKFYIISSETVDTNSRKLEFLESLFTKLFKDEIFSLFFLFSNPFKF